MSIERNSSTLKIDDVVTYLLYIRQNNMEVMNHDTLIARGWPIDRGKGKNLQYKVEVNGVYLRPNPIVQR